jgi:hypothetical protein
VVEIRVRCINLELFVVHPAEDEAVPHAEVVTPRQVSLALSAPETIDMVDEVAGAHHQLMGRDSRLATCTPLHSK